VVRYISPKATR